MAGTSDPLTPLVFPASPALPPNSAPTLRSPLVLRHTLCPSQQLGGADQGLRNLASLSSLGGGCRNIIPDPFSFSARTNISWTCWMFGIRSGADLNNPGMFFDLKPSADFSSAFRPLLNFLKDWATEFVSYTAHQIHSELTPSACKKSLILQFLA